MRYIVALDFDYFDGDFWFGGKENPLLPDMHEDALSEGYIRVFREYGDAVAFAKDVIARICDRADAGGDEHKETFIERLRNGLLADVTRMAESGEPITFDVGDSYGNWDIRIRLLERGENDGTWASPGCWY